VNGPRSLTTLTILDESLVIDTEPWPADMLTFQTGPPHAGTDALIERGRRDPFWTRRLSTIQELSSVLPSCEAGLRAPHGRTRGANR